MYDFVRVLFSVVNLVLVSVVVVVILVKIHEISSAPVLVIVLCDNSTAVVLLKFMYGVARAYLQGNLRPAGVLLRCVLNRLRL